jgi:probable F420-dependent oxidoreductase
MGATQVLVSLRPLNALERVLAGGRDASLNFIVNYPEMHGLERDLLDSGEVGEFAAAAEQAGFDGFALTEHPIPGATWLERGGHQTLDPFVGLAFAAAATERIRLVTHIAVAPYRNPFLLAKSAATLDRLSHGRFVLGLGAGYHKTEFFALGVDFDERNALFDEALDVLPRAWAGEPFEAEGLHFTARGVIQRPRPTQDPIPIWIGGNSRLSRRRVATRAQGWMPMGVPEEVAKSTRSPHIGSLAELGALIAEVKDLAGDRADELDFCMTYTGAGIARPTVDVERHRDTIAELAAAGVNWVNVGPPPMEASATLEFLRAFGETYCGD